MSGLVRAGARFLYRVLRGVRCRVHYRAIGVFIGLSRLSNGFYKVSIEFFFGLLQRSTGLQGFFKGSKVFFVGLTTIWFGEKVQGLGGRFWV